MATNHQQMLLSGHMFNDTDANPVLWIAVVIAIGMHLQLWFISFELPPTRPEQPELDVSLIELPAAQDSSASEQTVTQDTVIAPQPQAAAPEPEPEKQMDDQPQLLTAAASKTRISEAQPTTPELPSAADLFRDGLGTSEQQLLPQASLAPGELRKKYISASTQDWLYASYMNAWTQKVERVGNMNYPEQALRRNMRGDLVMSVGIRADGSLESIEVLRDSGYPVLDEAAIRIVELSAPFATLPEQIASEVDVLYITRTWRFSPDNKTFN